MREATIPTKNSKEKVIENLRSGLLRLRDGFVFIRDREEKKRIEEFTKTFNELILKIKKAQKRGLWRKTHFNLFAILGYQRLEEAHSNILAWLLNPEDSHGLGDKFLSAFFRSVFAKEPISYSSITVIRENQEGKDRPDVVVKGDNWWLVIENKIDGIEGKGQTTKYAKRWGRNGEIGENVFLVFLTPSGTLPACKHFKPVSYRVIREVLENICSESDTNFLIKHFAEHIFLDLEV
jgi:hypothetical protein